MKLIRLLVQQWKYIVNWDVDSRKKCIKTL